MPLELWTGPFRTRDRDRVDITRAGCDRARAAGKPAPGAFLAPSAALVFPALAALRAVEEAERALPVPRWAGEARAALWERYEAAYLADLRATYRRDRSAFEAFLARARLVFVCFCTGEAAAAQRCHRFIAARVYAKLGAVYCGEIRDEDVVSPPAGAEEPPAILFGPERPCQSFMLTDGSGAGGIVCRGRGQRKKTPACVGCGRAALLLCDAPAPKKSRTCDAPICEQCAVTVGEDRHNCPKHVGEMREARSG